MSTGNEEFPLAEVIVDADGDEVAEADSETVYFERVIEGEGSLISGGEPSRIWPGATGSSDQSGAVGFFDPPPLPVLLLPLILALFAI